METYLGWTGCRTCRTPTCNAGWGVGWVLPNWQVLCCVCLQVWQKARDIRRHERWLWAEVDKGELWWKEKNDWYFASRSVQWMNGTSLWKRLELRLPTSPEAFDLVYETYRLTFGCVLPCINKLCQSTHVPVFIILFGNEQKTTTTLIVKAINNLKWGFFTQCRISKMKYTFAKNQIFYW